MDSQTNCGAGSPDLAASGLATTIPRDANPPGNTRFPHGAPQTPNPRCARDRGTNSRSLNKYLLRDSSLGPRHRFVDNLAELNAPNVNSPARPAPSVHAITGWRRFVLWPFARFVRLWGSSLRFVMTAEDVRNCSKRDIPVAFVLWHNRLFLASEIHRRFRAGRPLYALISASKDGAMLTTFFSLIGGVQAVRGSSSNYGREAASTLVELQRAGYDIGITPDGPRGPCYELKPGAVIVPRRTGAAILLIGGEFESAWRLKSWDRFYLPKPFSRVRLHCEVVESHELADRDAAIARLQRRLLELNPDANA